MLFFVIIHWLKLCVIHESYFLNNILIGYEFFINCWKVQNLGIKLVNSQRVKFLPQKAEFKMFKINVQLIQAILWSIKLQYYKLSFLLSFDVDVQVIKTCNFTLKILYITCCFIKNVLQYSFLNLEMSFPIITCCSKI